MWLAYRLSPMVLGMVYGLLHVVGPDHLGTLIALSVANPPNTAFYVGLAWALGHSIGMITAAAVVLLLQRVTRIDVDGWEHVGNYIIGLSMLLCGLYFIVREGDHLEDKGDGTFVVRDCSCTADQGGTPKQASNFDLRPALLEGRRRSGSRPSPAFCGSYGTMDTPSPSLNVDVSSPFLVASESGEAVPKVELEHEHENPLFLFSKRELRGTVLGLVQGLCCPMGLVGAAFLATLDVVQIAIFMISSLVVSVVFTGCLTWSWSWLVSNEKVTRAVPTRVLYRSSCLFTVILGIAWMAANYFDVLWELNYAEHSHGGKHAGHAPALIGLGKSGIPVW